MHFVRDVGLNGKRLAVSYKKTSKRFAIFELVVTYVSIFHNKKYFYAIRFNIQLYVYNIYYTRCPQSL